MILPLKHLRRKQSHTCEWCACRVVYHHPGIPATHVRTGLGVDEPAVPFLNESQGVVPGALLRLPRCDGFLMDVLPVTCRSAGTICRRLDQGHPAIGLQGDHVEALHWVVIGGHSGKYLPIMDSLSHTPSGCRRTMKKNAMKEFISFFSIAGNDGEPRETSALGMLRSFPEPQHLTRIICNEVRKRGRNQEAVPRANRPPAAFIMGGPEEPWQWRGRQILDSRSASPIFSVILRSSGRSCWPRSFSWFQVI